MPDEDPTYYEQWGPIERRIRYGFNWISMLWAKEVTVLIECKWRLGDEIMALPVYQSFKESYEQDPSFKKKLRLVALCNYPEVLEGNPFVSAVNPEHIWPQLYCKLRGAERDVNREAYNRRVIGLDRVCPDYPLLRPKLHYSDWSTPLLDEISSGEGPVVALCRGASWETKQWTVERWTQLGHALEGRGCRVIVLGKHDEKISVGTDFTGRTSVRDAACLLHHADLTVSNDSGLMHLSLAADTGTIGLFGPTDPAILIEDDNRFVPITNGRECQGCWNRDLSIEEPGVCPKDIAACMETISLERVLLAVDEALGVSK